ncbi:MAG: 50S ribosomal protein L29 [Candidatus Omnitrophica bacterium 4484_171]|nr:MAG: 50S ribosomal protein L29 [Candidatus Omnitrophica bacterium 4484_171]
MKNKEYNDLSVEELRAKLQDLRKRLMELSFQRKISHVEKPHLFKTTKRNIARILTLLREKTNG